jgi:hypothetical protein
MDWYSVGIAAGCGAIAGGIGAVVSRAAIGGKSQTIIHTIVTVGLFSVLYAWANNSIIADHKKQVALAQFESEILGNPAFEALKEYEPEAMEDIRSYLDEAVDNSHDSLLIQTNTRQILSNILVSRIPKASDSALLEMSGLLIDQMTALHERGDDSCFRFLHPNVAGGIDAAAVFSGEMMGRDYAATESILSSFDENRAAPDEEQAMRIFNPIVANLVDKHGQAAVAQLSNVTAQETDRSLVCAMTIDLYTEITVRPVDETAIVLRWMFK